MIMRNSSGINASDKKANRLAATKIGGKLVNDYWNSLFNAKEEGKKVVWYNGTYIPPFFQAHDLAWVHGEAWAAYLAAKHLETDAQQEGENHGFDRELCSYARTHIGQALIDKRKVEEGIISPSDPRAEDIKKLPPPDMFINAYPYCSSGQQWDDLIYRLYGKRVPIFNINIPLLWGGKPDAGYLYGQEWEEKSDYVSMQLIEMTKFLEEHTGRKYDWDRLGEIMGYIKQISELRLEAMDLCTARPSPASFFDWAVSIAHVNFLPGNQANLDYFKALKAEIQTRVKDGVGSAPNEKYRLFFDGMMNWNKIGWLADKFAAIDATIVAGRYTHMSFWQEPQLIDVANPVRGMAQNYLVCPNNHGAPIMVNEIDKLCDKFDIDGIVCHVSRTCRGMTNNQFLIADSATQKGRQAIFFEGDVADESFYKDELLNTRLEAMVEALEAKSCVA